MSLVETAELDSLVAILTCRRLPVLNERALQDEIQSMLFDVGVRFEREARLDCGGVVDFIVGDGIAIEAKVKGGKMQIYHQCNRYCLSAAVRGLILASSIHVALPATIHGKPARVANLSRAWL